MNKHVLQGSKRARRMFWKCCRGGQWIMEKHNIPMTTGGYHKDDKKTENFVWRSFWRSSRSLFCCSRLNQSESQQHETSGAVRRHYGLRSELAVWPSGWTGSRLQSLGVNALPPSSDLWTLTLWPSVRSGNKIRDTLFKKVTPHPNSPHQSTVQQDVFIYSKTGHSTVQNWTGPGISIFHLLE